MNCNKMIFTVIAVHLGFLCLAEPLDISSLCTDLEGIKTEVKYPSQAVIAEHQHAIDEQLKQNDTVRSVLKGGVGIGLLGAAYLVFKDYKLVGPDDHIHQQALARQVVAISAYLKEKFPDMSVDTALKISEAGGSWFDTCKQFVAYEILALGAMYIKDFVFNQIFYDTSIEWFSKEQTTIESIYEELDSLHKDMQELKKGSMYITPYQADRYVNGLIRLHNACIDELEKIIGYVNCRGKLSQKNAALYGDVRLGVYLYARAYNLAQILDGYKNTYHAAMTNDQRVAQILGMFNEIYHFSVDLNSSLTGFKRFEQRNRS